MKIEFSDREIEVLKVDLRRFKEEAWSLENKVRAVVIAEGQPSIRSRTDDDANVGEVRLAAVAYSGVPGRPFYIRWIASPKNMPQLEDAIAEVFDEAT